MADTTFTSGTIVTKEWLQAINDFVYNFSIPEDSVISLAASGGNTTELNGDQLLFGDTNFVISSQNESSIITSGSVYITTGDNTTGNTGDIIFETGASSSGIRGKIIFNGGVSVTPVALTDQATITTDARLSNTFTVTLGGNRTLANPTNMANGAIYTWRVRQDGTGSRTLAYGSKFKWPDGTAPVLSTSASATDFISGQYFSDTDTLLCVAQLGFA